MRTLLFVYYLADTNVHAASHRRRRTRDVRQARFMRVASIQQVHVSQLRAVSPNPNPRAFSRALSSSLRIACLLVVRSSTLTGSRGRRHAARTRPSPPNLTQRQERHRWSSYAAVPFALTRQFPAVTSEACARPQLGRPGRTFCFESFRPETSGCSSLGALSDQCQGSEGPVARRGRLVDEREQDLWNLGLVHVRSNFISPSVNGRHP